MAQNAMNAFTNAATAASLLCRARRLTFLQNSADLDSINASNNTSTQLSAAISLACAANLTNSSYKSQFQEYCASGSSYIGLAARISKTVISSARGLNKPVRVRNQSSREFDCICKWEHFPGCFSCFTTRSVVVPRNEAQKYIVGPSSQSLRYSE